MPAKAGIQYSRALRDRPRRHGVLDRPPSRTTTTGDDDRYYVVQINVISPPLISSRKFRHGLSPMTTQPFFTKDRDVYIPTDAARGPWDPSSLHGRVIIGLLAFMIEQHHGADDFVPVRLTVDMFRLPNLAPIEVKTRLVRDGLHIRVVEADFFSGGVNMARASCQLLRKTENPQGQVWSPPKWDVPAPADIAVPEDPRLGMNGKWTTRPITGAMGTVGPRRLWMSEVRELVQGYRCRPSSMSPRAPISSAPLPTPATRGSATSTVTSRSICIACR